MKKNIVLGFIGEDGDAGEVLFKGFKEFPPEKVILLIKEGFEKMGTEIKKDLDKFGIEFESEIVGENLHLEEVFLLVKKYNDLYKNESLVINVDTDYFTSCLALSSAFVNGIPAVGILKEEVMVYPIMKFSYSNSLNEKKMELLNIIFQNKEVESMEKLSKLSGLSLPLIAYHLKGNRDTQGLEELNLIKLTRNSGALRISLTPLGNLIVKGGISSGKENLPKKRCKK